jgi:hypothetical protein
MRGIPDDQTYAQNTWDENATYTDVYGGGYETYEDADAYEEDEDYGDYDDYEESALDEELGREHNFRIAMSVFDLISMLVGLAVILVLTALLFGLFNWVQRDISQSLSVITAPFR